MFLRYEALRRERDSLKLRSVFEVVEIVKFARFNLHLLTLEFAVQSRQGAGRGREYRVNQTIPQKNPKEGFSKNTYERKRGYTTRDHRKAFIIS